MAEPTPPWESTASAPPAPWESSSSSGSSPKSSLTAEDFTIFGALKNAGKSVLHEMGEGAGDLKDLITGNSFKDQPKAQEDFKEKFDSGEAGSSDVKQLFLQGEANNPAGKAMGAARIFPPIALASSAMNNVINPGIEGIVKYIGGDKEDVPLTEQLLTPLGMRAPKVDVLSKPLTSAAKGIKDAALHPIDTVGKGVNAAGRAASAVGKPIVKPLAIGMLESDNPVFGGGYKASLESPTAKEGERLGKKLGVKFSGGELTGNAAARNVEDVLANSAKYSEKFSEENQKKTDAIVGNFKKTLDEVYPKSVSGLDVGDKISTSYKQTIDSLAKSRSQQFRSDLGLAKQASKGEAIIAPDNFVKVLKKYVSEGENPVAHPAQVAAAREAKAILENLKIPSPKPSLLLDQNGDPIKFPSAAESYKHLTIDDLQSGLQGYGDAAYTGGGILKKLASASDTRFAKEAKSALEKDMDSTASSGGNDAAKYLKNARDNFRKNSSKISDIEKSTLGKMIGDAEYDSEGKITIPPEKMAAKFLSMGPTEISNTLKFLDKSNPEVANMARRYTLESVLEKSMEGKGQRGEGTSKSFPKSEFVKSLPSGDKLNAIMGSTKAANDVRDVAAALNRMIDYGAEKKGSQTAMRLEGMVKWGKGALYRSIASDSLAEDLLDPTRRRELAEEAKKNNKP